MNQLEKHGKGMILMHYFKHHTADAPPELLRELKAGGYKVVHMLPKGEVTTVPKYDEMLAHEDKLSSNNTRPDPHHRRTRWVPGRGASAAPRIPIRRPLGNFMSRTPRHTARAVVREFGILIAARNSTPKPDELQNRCVTCCGRLPVLDFRPCWGMVQMPITKATSIST
jgi:hypothetical protein